MSLYFKRKIKLWDKKVEKLIKMMKTLNQELKKESMKKFRKNLKRKRVDEDWVVRDC